MCPFKFALRISGKLNGDNVMGHWVKKKKCALKRICAGCVAQSLCGKLSLNFSALSSSADLLFWLLTCGADWQVAGNASNNVFQ